ncbi:hypothetical protein JRQ81_008397 [Phrynocephalus forsythii]|uniref:Uncharacterized protein n=1 Tax=Phrynocephalus forsythii TaxID=171643 RepID=A0A9Q0XBW8_9SAUR|nr:hypothetical protein JRQ81_008397 [Phrynocephalus forsythii]
MKPKIYKGSPISSPGGQQWHHQPEPGVAFPLAEWCAETAKWLQLQAGYHRILQQEELLTTLAQP